LGIALLLSEAPANRGGGESMGGEDNEDALAAEGAPSGSAVQSDDLVVESVALETRGKTIEHEGDLARRTTIVLAEFSALRSEVATRISLLYSLLLGYFTVVGVILGITFSRPSNKAMFLLIPIVTGFIGILVIDMYINLDTLGGYIYRVIRPQLQIKSVSKVEDMSVFDWERWAAKHQFTGLAAFPQLALVLEFFAVPLAILTYAFVYHLQHPHVQVTTLQLLLWSAGAAMTTAQVLFAVAFSVRSIFRGR
jgi:hypothetical protein